MLKAPPRPGCRTVMLPCARRLCSQSRSRLEICCCWNTSRILGSTEASGRGLAVRLSVLRQHGVLVKGLHLGVADRRTRTEALLDECQHLHPLLPPIAKLGRAETVAREEAVPSGIRGAFIVLQAGMV